MQESMRKSQSWQQTGLSYHSKTNPSPHNQSQKQNITPCTAQYQSIASLLIHKKCELKNIQLENQKLNEICSDQKSRLEMETIRQQSQGEREQSLLAINLRTTDEIQLLRCQKLRYLEKMHTCKKQLQDKYYQILEIKQIIPMHQEEGSILQEKINCTQDEIATLTANNNQLQFLQQKVDCEFYKMKQTVRQSEVQKTTIESVLAALLKRNAAITTQLKNQNKQTRILTQILPECSDKNKRLREQKAQNQINSHQLCIKNQQIQSINSKLRSDLQKCQKHLTCVVKNNDVLTNCIQEFQTMDAKVTRLINRKEYSQI